MAMVLQTSGDIPTDVRDSLLAELRAVVEVDKRYELAIKFADSAPSTIQLIGEVLKWAPLSVAATAFLTRLAVRAADATWDRSTQIAAALFDRAVQPLRRFVAAFKKASDAAPRKVEVLIGLAIPDDRWGTVIILDPSDEPEAVWLLANLVAKRQAIADALRKELQTAKPFGAIELEVLPDGTLKLRWRTQKDMQLRELLVS